MTSLGSATTQMVDLSRRGLAHRAQSPSPWVRFWQTGQFTAQDRIQAAGLYSKQMEYSEENWAGLEEALLFDQAFEDALLQDLLCSL